ncbi:MAG: hypothetical protein ABI460_00540 [Caldimonas sp.]
MIPERSPVPIRTAVALLLLSGLAACGVLKKDETVQSVVNKRVIGMPAGDFFDQYGKWKQRAELLDGTVEFSWTSAIGASTAAGYIGLDDRTCTLRLVVAKNGKIASADVVLDNQGRASVSRCEEMFKAK